MDEDTRDRLERNFASASANVRKGMGGKGGDAAEKVYGQAYFALVQAGLRPQLREKYR